MTLWMALWVALWALTLGVTLWALTLWVAHVSRGAVMAHCSFVVQGYASAFKKNEVQ
jgi:hypothetical protein